MKKFIVNFVIGLCLIGIGLAVGFSEFTSLKFVDYVGNTKPTIEEFTFEIPENIDNIYIQNSSIDIYSEIKTNIEIDESIGNNQIKFLYENKYNFNLLNIHPSFGKSISSDAIVSEVISFNFYVNTNLDFYIEKLKSLKNKTLINKSKFNLKVLVSSENFKKIKDLK